MRRVILSIALVASVLAFAGVSKADTVELPLNCAGTYGFNSYWQANFDLGVTFSEISHVYIDWSGGITAGRAIYYTDPCNPFPLDVGIYASLGSNPWPRSTEVWGGESTYPEPEIFDKISQFSLLGISSWSDLLDGQGNIMISHTSFYGDGWNYIDYGSVILNDATLIVEGTVIPEPATFILLVLGFTQIIRRKSRSHTV
jgi:hypothetical protein